MSDKTTERPFPPLTDADIAAAIARTEEDDVREARAVAAHYNRESEQLAVTLRGGMTLLIPVRLLQGVSGAPAELIEEVEVVPHGTALHWETLDADFSVQGLVAGSFGTRQWMHELKRQGLLDEASLARLDLVDRLHATGRLGRSAPAAVETGCKGGSTRSEAKAGAARDIVTARAEA